MKKYLFVFLCFIFSMPVFAVEGFAIDFDKCVMNMVPVTLLAPENESKAVTIISGDTFKMRCERAGDFASCTTSIHKGATIFEIHSYQQYNVMVQQGGHAKISLDINRQGAAYVVPIMDVSDSGMIHGAKVCHGTIWPLSEPSNPSKYDN